MYELRYIKRDDYLLNYFILIREHNVKQHHCSTVRVKQAELGWTPGKYYRNQKKLLTFFYVSIRVVKS